jgi:DNA-binding LacI/PurR family transcriptional regulator
MRDVAKLAGVSQSTVSRVLSQKTSDIPISEETLTRVKDAVKTLGYRPNVTARSLRTQRTHMIAVMIADISNPFYHTITRTIQNIAAEQNYDVLISNTDHLLTYERRFFEAMMRRPVDGMILVPYHLGDEDLDELLQRTGSPISVLGQQFHHPEVDVVSGDDETALYEAIHWLIHEKQHERIGFLGADATFSISIRRQQGYERALREANLPLEPDWMQYGEFTADSGYRMMRSLLELPIRPTAVFACNDIIAIGALNAVLDSGLEVPRDIAIMGFDNVPEASLVRPKLTTIAQYPAEIGQRLAETIFDRIHGEAVQAGRRFTVPLKLIVRQSV